MFTGINYRYLAEKFVRDAAAFFVASTAFQQFTSGVGAPDFHTLGVALLGACGTAAYRLVRELGLFGEAKA